MIEIKPGKKMLWLTSWPYGRIKEVEIIERNIKIGDDCWYIRKGLGSTDTTSSEFLFDYPESMNKVEVKIKKVVDNKIDLK